jgi:hypothetical protein
MNPAASSGKPASGAPQHLRQHRQQLRLATGLLQHPVGLAGPAGVAVAGDEGEGNAALFEQVGDR